MANALGVTCQGGFGKTAASQSFVEKAEAFYMDGGTPMVAAMGGLIALGVLTVLCCCRSIRQDVSALCSVQMDTHAGFVLNVLHA